MLDLLWDLANNNAYTGYGAHHEVLRRHRARSRQLSTTALRLERERALVRGDPKRARSVQGHVLPRR